jgi:hypothetical protein
MSKATVALTLVESTLEQLHAAGCKDSADPGDPARRAMGWLYYIEAFLTWEVKKEDYDGTMVALSAESLDDAAFQDHPHGMKMGVNAVVNAGDTLESVLEELPGRIELARTLLTKQGK